MEARVDGAHFSDATCAWLAKQKIEYSVSVPFERFPKLKRIIEARRRWRVIDGEWAYFCRFWSPGSWEGDPQLIFVFRRLCKEPRKGPIQLDLFEPVSRHYEYKVTMTNKQVGARSLLAFHNGRGAQEGVFAEAKTDLCLGYIPMRRLLANQVYLLTTCIAHAIGREMQMRAEPPARKTNPTRACLWIFQKLGTLRRRCIQQAGRLTRPRGRLTLTLSQNAVVQDDFERLLRPWTATA
jgi:hypothetical protein